MNWKTTILSASEMSSDGDATLEVQTEFVFGSSDFYSSLPGYERIEGEVEYGIERIFFDKDVSWLSKQGRQDVYPEYTLAAPDLDRHPKSWGRLIWRSVLEVNADTQEQVDALIGLTHEETDRETPPF